MHGYNLMAAWSDHIVKLWDEVRLFIIDCTAVAEYFVAINHADQLHDIVSALASIMQCGCIIIVWLHGGI